MVMKAGGHWGVRGEAGQEQERGLREEIETFIIGVQLRKGKEGWEYIGRHHHLNFTVVIYFPSLSLSCTTTFILFHYGNPHSILLKVLFYVSHSSVIVCTIAHCKLISPLTCCHLFIPVTAGRFDCDSTQLSFPLVPTGCLFFFFFFLPLILFSLAYSYFIFVVTL